MQRFTVWSLIEISFETDCSCRLFRGGGQAVILHPNAKSGTNRMPHRLNRGWLTQMLFHLDSQVINRASVQPQQFMIIGFHLVIIPSLEDALKSPLVYHLGRIFKMSSVSFGFSNE
jgi:hypothetical protein